MGIKLPDGFTYPSSLKRIIALNIVNIEPWWILDEDEIEDKFNGLQQRYTNRILIPFARRQDTDDVACFELNKGEEVQIIHDYASPGWEQRQTYDNFWDWFREAIEDLIKWEL